MREQRSTTPPPGSPADGLLANNILGQHGPRCPMCSGLGRNLRLPSGSYVTRHTSPCICKGTGIDQELLREEQMSMLLRRLDKLEADNAKLFKKLGVTSKSKLTQGKMTRQYWSECINWLTTDGTALANTTTEAIIVPDITIPANYMADGRALRLTVFGRVGATATPTLTFFVRKGGVAGTPIICQSAAVTLAAVTAAQFMMEIVIQSRTNGTAGTIFGQGVVHWGATIKTTNTPDFMGSAGATTPASVSSDFTVDWALSVTGDWSAASASNTLTVHNYIVESLN